VCFKCIGTNKEKWVGKWFKEQMWSSLGFVTNVVYDLSNTTKGNIVANVVCN
jgi:hypothetical protein